MEGAPELKAAVVKEFKQPLIIEDRPIPEPGDGRAFPHMVVTLPLSRQD
jgi:D-arabinose 1-dehydrogenase-like Zn-dependent alcohol dehydrogenase